MLSLEIFSPIMSTELFLYFATAWAFFEQFTLRKTRGVSVDTLVYLCISLSYNYDDEFQSFIKFFFLILAMIFQAIAISNSPKTEVRLVPAYVCAGATMAMIGVSFVHLTSDERGKDRVFVGQQVCIRYVELFGLSYMGMTIKKFNKYPFIPLMLVHYIWQAVYFYHFDWPYEFRDKPKLFYGLIVHNIIILCAGVILCVSFYYIQYFYRETINSDVNVDKNLRILVSEVYEFLKMKSFKHVKNREIIISCYAKEMDNY